MQNRLAPVGRASRNRGLAGPWLGVVGLLVAACAGGGGPAAPISTGQPDVSTSGEPASSFGAARTEEPIAGTFQPIVLSGKGSKVKKFSIPENAAAIAVVSEKGTSNFVIWSLASDGSENDLLVNDIGNYAGTVLFDGNAGEHSVGFKIESNGTWKITIKPVTLARHWNGSTALSGKGDDVVYVSPPSNGLTVVTLKHSGDSNFAIWAYGEEAELIVNDIGKYNGETTLPNGTILLEITANGSWSVTPS